MKGVNLLRIVKGMGLFLLFMLILTASALAESEEANYSLPIDFSPGKPVDQANYISENEYKDPTLHVVIEKGRKDNCDYWLARIKIADPSQLRTAAAGGFENEATIKGTFLAKRQNAVLAIDGDYYAYHPFGLIVRQGIRYRDKLQGHRDVLLIDEDGNFNQVHMPAADTIGTTVNGKKIINAFHFGPSLVTNRKVANLVASWWMVPDEKRQRMCIAQMGELEYMALCCAGPARGSEGMTIRQFANLAWSLGAIEAYNLDGGDSTMLIFNGEKINDVRNTSTRDISDIIYFASAWDGK